MINSVYRLVAPGLIDIACTEPDLKNSVIMRPVYLSVCKADQRYYLGRRSREALKAKLPMALIHECVAKVIFDPTGNFKVGEYVVPVPNMPTEEDDVIAENYRLSSHFCSSGYDGFLRDYIDMPADRLVRVPEGVDLKVASFSELISVAVHAVNRFPERTQSASGATATSAISPLLLSRLFIPMQSSISSARCGKSSIILLLQTAFITLTTCLPTFVLTTLLSVSAVKRHATQSLRLLI